jgi:uncharacterized protein with HEPN domain
MRAEAAALFWDAKDAADSIMLFLDGVAPDEYDRDLLRRRAVERGFEIVGEALNRLRRIDPATASRIPKLANAVGLRNVLIHGYAEIIDRRVFDTAVKDLPELLEVLTTLMDEVNDSR